MVLLYHAQPVPSKGHESLPCSLEAGMPTENSGHVYSVTTAYHSGSTLAMADESDIGRTRCFPQSIPFGTRQVYDNLNGKVNGSTAHHPRLGWGKKPLALSAGVRCPEPIAVCGLALRLPGGIRDSEAFWDALLNGRDMKGPVPPERHNSTAFLASQEGYFIEEDLGGLDTSFFKLRKNELEVADPQQRQLLEVTRECLENAGETKYRGKSIGCYVGTFGEDWLHLACKDEQCLGGNSVIGFLDLMLANRISYEFDFQGPR
jgi:hypothetical protein